MSICDSGIGIKLFSQSITINVSQDHPLIILANQLPWEEMFDLIVALESSADAISRIGRETARVQLREQKTVKDRLELGFVNLGLAKRAEPVDLKNRCFWVPASVNHEVKPLDTGGLARHSFFVYGGVRVQPRVNVTQGGNAPLGGTAVGRAALANMNTQTVLYQKVGPNGEHLKFGITNNPSRRYTSTQLNGGKLKIIAQGNREDMLRLEREVHSTLPIGSEDRQSCYIRQQVAKGYRPPPY